MKWLKVAMLGTTFISSNLCGEQDYREITKRSYDETAVEYEANTIKLQPEVKAQAFLARLSSSSLILDLGCGPGRDARYFVEHGHQVIGVDISSQMVAIARKAVPDAEFIVSDIESLSLEAKSFDAVWASASLLHVSKQAMPGVLAKIHTLLKPDGVFYEPIPLICLARS